MTTTESRCPTTNASLTDGSFVIHSQDEFRQALVEISPFISTDPSVPILNCALLTVAPGGVGALVATDRHRLLVVPVRCSAAEPFTALLNREVVLGMQKRLRPKRPRASVIVKVAGEHTLQVIPTGADIEPFPVGLPLALFPKDFPRVEGLIAPEMYGAQVEPSAAYQPKFLVGFKTSEPVRFWRRQDDGGKEGSTLFTYADRVGLLMPHWGDHPDELALDDDTSVALRVLSDR